jgi:succinoglycan biosynthesis protein ExoO
MILPTVSVVMPAFDVEGFIERALTSALSQTHSPLEVLVVDDASSDSTRAVVERMACEHPEVRLIALPDNRGPARARNVAISEAFGEFVAILDADDAWRQDRLQRLLEVAVDHEADFVADNHVFFDLAAGVEEGIAFEADWDVKPLTAAGFFRNDLPEISPLNFGLLKPVIRRRFLQDEDLAYDEEQRYGEDFKLSAEVLLRGARAYVTSYPGYIYSVRIGAISGRPNTASSSVPRFDRLVAVSDELERKYGDRLDDETLSAIRGRRRHLSLIHLSNVGRRYRRHRRYGRYASFHLRHPRLVAMLARRVARRVLPTRAKALTSRRSPEL